jgi:nucleoside-diphosphate-sugar epimerase
LPEPVTEAQPTVAPGPATYSSRKIALEQTLLEGARRPVTILRPCAIHGIHSRHPREWWFVKRILDRRAWIPLALAGGSRFHTSAASNVAALAATALDHPGSRILNSADPDAVSVAEIGRLVAAHMGYAGRMVGLGPDAPGHVGRSPWSVPRPYILDTTAAAALGYAPRQRYVEAIGPLCDWLAAHDPATWEAAFPVLASYPWPQFDYAGEDALEPPR